MSENTNNQAGTDFSYFPGVGPTPNGAELLDTAVDFISSLIAKLEGEEAEERVIEIVGRLKEAVEINAIIKSGIEQKLPAHEIATNALDHANKIELEGEAQSAGIAMLKYLIEGGEVGLEGSAAIGLYGIALGILMEEGSKAYDKLNKRGIPYTGYESLMDYPDSEMYELQNQFNKSGNIQVDPVAVDLDWDGVESLSIKNGVNFDLNNDGVKEKTGWIAADDGLLVMDRDDNGTIDNGGELFGDQTPLKNGSIAATGYQALDELDSNHDGYITKEDADFNKLQVWVDKNQDGASQYDELYSLTDAGIEKINLDYKTGAGEDEQDNFQTRTAA